MKSVAIAVLGVCFSVTAAAADTKPTEAEAAKIAAAVAAWGCEGGTYEKESEGTGTFEADDVKCKAGQYDFRLDEKFSVLTITRD